jgi:cation:H+ antiporter
MGGPLALATVAYGVTGWMMLARRRRAKASARAPSGTWASWPATSAGSWRSSW